MRYNAKLTTSTGSGHLEADIKASIKEKVQDTMHDWMINYGIDYKGDRLVKIQEGSRPTESIWKKGSTIIICNWNIQEL